MESKLHTFQPPCPKCDTLMDVTEVAFYFTPLDDCAAGVVELTSTCPKCGMRDVKVPLTLGFVKELCLQHDFQAWCREATVSRMVN